MLGWSKAGYEDSLISAREQSIGMPATAVFLG